MKKIGIVFCFVIFFILALKTVDAADKEGIIMVNVIDSGDCVLDFKQGWNLFSFCSELQNTNLAEILAPIEGKYRYLMKWDKANQKFEIYSVLSSENPFTTFDDDESYFIYMFEDAQLNVLGDESGLESRNLIEGWATPSYPYRITRVIENMYAAIMPDLRYIMKWDNINQEFLIYSALSSENPFHELNKGEGQFIYMWRERILQY